MQIRDIVNRDIVNLTNCEHEPIHIPGSIQPHGFLLAYITETLTIDFCSGNISEFTTINHEQVLSKKLVEVFGAEQNQKILQYATSLSSAFTSPLILELNKRSFQTTIHHSGRCTILELEPLEPEELELATYYNQTRRFVSYMEKSTSLQALCQVIADETRAITGYDRVMIYRFDKHYNGEIFAEAKRDDIEPFFGLHYPHTDIPAQARELYKQNLLRLIVDVNYTPVPLYTVADSSDKNLDLSQSILRSVSPIHVQYLHNIGVGATLTISLMLQDKLWGLIACHHYSYKYLNSFTRVSAQLQGHFLTSQIHVREVAELHEQTKNINLTLERILPTTVLSNLDAIETIVRQEELLTIANASGIAILCRGRLFVNGKVPGEAEIRKLMAAVNKLSPGKQFITSKLIDDYPDGVNIADTASGIFYYPFSMGSDDGIMWFRQEALQEVKWAGDPNKAIIKDEKGLSPRKSFSLWKEIIKQQSHDWNEAEIFAGSTLGQTIERQLHLLSISEKESRSRILSEKLKKTNDELENVNWIGTHDLKEPLRKIQVFASMLLARSSNELPENVVTIVEKMSSSASRMDTLLTDILAYSKLLSETHPFEKVDLNVIMKQVLIEIDDEINDKKCKITTGILPTVEGTPFLIRQVFMNLVNNSIKFSRKDLPAEISVTASVESLTDAASESKVYHKITIADNGIGFEQEYKEKIFNVFSRLHAQTEYRGSGIGLALCRKIMDNHNGFITAQSKLGEGATFSLFFPVES